MPFRTDEAIVRIAFELGHTGSLGYCWTQDGAREALGQKSLFRSETEGAGRGMMYQVSPFAHCDMDGSLGCPSRMDGIQGGRTVADALTRLNSLTQPIKIAIIGMGHAGKGLLCQCGMTPGIKCVAVADIAVDKATDACQALDCSYEIVEDLGSLHNVIQKGKTAVCQDGELLARCESVDVLFEATNTIAHAGRYAEMALQNGIHVLMRNAEADLTLGPYLMRVAKSNGVVYSSADGDQPGVLQRLIRDIRLWGFELVMAGNIKGFLNRYANPTNIIPEADKRFLDYKMCTAFTDGTKLAVEMAVLANALGLDTDVPGMHGPKAKELLEVFDLFDFERWHANGKAMVDYVCGSRPYGGVFVVGFSDNRYQQKMMEYFPSRLGTGPFYVFDRPYHLCHVEAMQGVLEAFMDHESLLEPTHGFRTNVYAYAKRELHKGETLDGLGGYACYGVLENITDNLVQPGIPICLANNVMLSRDVAKDEKVLMSDVIYNAQRPDFKMFALASDHSDVMVQQHTIQAVSEHRSGAPVAFDSLEKRP